MVTEGGAHVVINLEPVWHVDVETFFLKYGVPAVGRSSRTPADDLVDAFLVDGSIAFLRRHRPRRRTGRPRRGRVCELAPAGPVQPSTQSHRSPDCPHPHPTEAGPGA